MSTEVSVVVDHHAACGEGPFWHAPSESVIWIDIVRGDIFRTPLRTGDTQRVVRHREMVGAVAPREDGGFVAATESGFVELTESGKVSRQVPCLGAGERMNDAKPDPAGRYWSGSCTMDFKPGQGGLWLLDENWNATKILSGLTLPNGLGWSPDGRTFYLIDSMDRTVLSFPFDPDTSTLTTQSTILVGPDAFTGLPDGLAVDTRGHLWVAEYAGSAVHEFDPTGALVRKIAIPTAQPTSCAFVGPELNQLWVTSAADGLETSEEVHAGSVFKVDGLNATGLPVANFRG